MTTAEQIDRRNFILNVTEGSLFIASAGFISVQTVLPALVSRLGGGNVAVGALSVIAWVGLFLPQILAARYVETLPFKKPWTVMFGLAHRSVIGVIGVVILVFGLSHSHVALGLFLGLYTTCQLLSGVATPGWFDLFAKVTSPHRRGRLVGIRNSLGGAAATLCGLLLTWLLHAFPFPSSYAIAFFLAFGLQMASMGTLVKLTELEPSVVVERRPFFAYLQRVPEVIHGNIHFRRFLIAVVFSVLAAMPVAFFTVYALNRFGGSESLVGEFTLIMVATQVVSALVIGYIADRHGNRIALVIASAAMMAASLCAVLSPSLELFRLVYVFLGINLGTELMARYNMSIEFGPVEQRSTYVGLMNTLTAPFYTAGVLGGWISDRLGYPSVFWLGAIFSLVGILVLLFLVRDPRRHSRGVNVTGHLDSPLPQSKQSPQVP